MNKKKVILAITDLECAGEIILKNGFNGLNIIIKKSDVKDNEYYKTRMKYFRLVSMIE